MTEKGSALVIVLLLTALLYSLGSVFLNFAFLETLLSRNQEKAIQAFYLAEAGAEAALGVLLEQDPGFRGNFSGSLGNNEFWVEVTEFMVSGSEQWVKVTSTGEAGKASETIALVYQTVPTAGENAVLGYEEGWYHEEEGVLITWETGEDGEKEIIEQWFSLQPVLFESSASSGKIYLELDEKIALYAPGLFFPGEKSLQVAGALELKAGTVVFDGPVIMENTAASLTFSPLDKLVRVYFSAPVKNSLDETLLQAGCYEFTETFIVHSDYVPGAAEDYRVPFKVPGSLTWQ